METKKGIGCGWEFIFIALGILVILVVGVLAGRDDVLDSFERHGYVLIREDGVEAVATITPVFEEWGK